MYITFKKKVVKEHVRIQRELSKICESEAPSFGSIWTQGQKQQWKRSNKEIFWNYYVPWKSKKKSWKEKDRTDEKFYLEKECLCHKNIIPSKWGLRGFQAEDQEEVCSRVWGEKEKERWKEEKQSFFEK